jgi:formylglycine-generating enzyme
MKVFGMQQGKTMKGNMNKLILGVWIATALVLVAGCKSDTGVGGQLIGDLTKLPYKAPVPIGMVYIPSGYFKMGASDEDIRGRNDATIHTVQVNGFYMDATEISNQEYRQFTIWCRDSIALSKLGFMKDMPNGDQRIDWSKQHINYKDPEVQDNLQDMYLNFDQNGWGVRLLDATKLVYTYKTFDYLAAAQHSHDPGYNELKYVKEIVEKVYPDTTVWMRQYAYAFNEPIAQQYFWFQGFNRYPVVGVNWNQCVAFCNWRTMLWSNERAKMRLYTESRFRLPSEQEWEWAARGGRNESPYPWGGPYIINKKGCYLANFKPQRGNYSADGGLYTVPVDKYAPNDYGLKNMSGNVSEWTSTAYFGGNYNHASDINGSVTYNYKPGDPAKDGDPLYLRRKVVRGGSWRDVAYFLQVGTRDYEYADTSKAYIGFRTAYTEVEPSLRNNRRPVR